MDPNTGRIFTPEEQKPMSKKRQKELEPIPHEDLVSVQSMTTEQRIEWADKRRRARNKRKAEKRKNKR